MTVLFSKVWIINSVLALLILSGWVWIWDTPDPESIIPARPRIAEESRAVPPKAGIAVARPDPSPEYENIVEMNLFSPERTFVPEIEAEPENVIVEEEVKISGEKVVLYGVVVVDDVKKALINNPTRKPGDRDFLWITEGQRLSNLQVTRIEPEQLLLNDGAAQYSIGLYDPEKARQKASAPSRASSSPQRDAPQVISADPAPAPPPSKQSGADAETRIPTQRQRTETPNQKVADDDDDEYEIVDTPFGPFRRKKTK